MVSPNTRRRFLAASGVTIVGLSGCLSSNEEGIDELSDDETDSSSDESNPEETQTPSNHDRTLEWEGQGSEHATQDCSGDELGFWKWILTPGGPDSIVVDDDQPVLTVEFEDGSEETVTGFRPGAGGGAVQFEVFEQGGGTVTGAKVGFSGGGDNPVLTISEGECVDDEGEGDEEEDEEDEEEEEEEDDEKEEEDEEEDDEDKKSKKERKKKKHEEKCD